MRHVPEPVGLTPPREAAPLVRFAGLVLDLDACALARESGEAITLTRGEFAILRMFVARPGRVLSRDLLLDALANRRFEAFDRSVDVLVGRLRRKIEPDPKQPWLIVTVPGQGYRFDGLAKSPAPKQDASIAAQASENQDPRAGLKLSEPSALPCDSAKAQPAHLLAAVPGSKPGDGGSPKPTTAIHRLRSAHRSDFMPLVAVLAALLLVATAGWSLLGRGLTKPLEAGHLSIVALPFVNLSGDPGQDYLADGITDNLTTELARIRNSFVIARNTAFAYKGKTIDAKQIAAELGVRYVLEGSVQRAGTRVRVNAQLIDAASGAHLWVDRFEDDVADLLKLQDEVVTRLAHGLNLALIEAEAEKAAHAPKPDAMDLTMRGTDLLLRTLSQPEGEMRKVNGEARALFKRALEIDPTDADALAGSAATYLREFVFGWGDPKTDYEAEVLGQANRAIALDPNRTAAYQVKADYLNSSGRPRAALGAANAGLAANPNNVALYAPRADAEDALGRFDDAKADAEHAIRLSPRDPFLGTLFDILGDAEINLGLFGSAIEAYRKALNAGHRYFPVYANLAAAYALAGQMAEAKAALEEARRLNPTLTITSTKDQTPNFQAVFDGLRKAGLPEE